MKHANLCILLLVIGVTFSQSAATQGEHDSSPRLVEITDSVFRTEHAPGAANSVIIETNEGLVVVDGTCRGAGDPV